MYEKNLSFNLEISIGGGLRITFIGNDQNVAIFSRTERPDAIFFNPSMKPEV